MQEWYKECSFELERNEAIQKLADVLISIKLRPIAHEVKRLAGIKIKRKSTDYIPIEGKHNFDQLSATMPNAKWFLFHRTIGKGEKKLHILVSPQVV